MSNNEQPADMAMLREALAFYHSEAHTTHFVPLMQQREQEERTAYVALAFALDELERARERLTQTEDRIRILVNEMSEIGAICWHVNQGGVDVESAFIRIQLIAEKPADAKGETE